MSLPAREWERAAPSRSGSAHWRHTARRSRIPEAWVRGDARSVRQRAVVADIQMGNREWAAFMADRFPRELDDDIKRHRAAFCKAAEMLKAEDLFDVIPIGLHMTPH